MTRWTRRHRFKIGDRVEFIGETTLAQGLETLGLIDHAPKAQPRRGTIIGFVESLKEPRYEVVIDQSGMQVDVGERGLDLLPILERLSEIMGPEIEGKTSQRGVMWPKRRRGQ
jgi:hypothetical protein